MCCAASLRTVDAAAPKAGAEDPPPKEKLPPAGLACTSICAGHIQADMKSMQAQAIV